MFLPQDLQSLNTEVNVMDIKFTKGCWEEYFEHAYNEKFPFKPQFIQEENCIVNGSNPEMKDFAYDYTTIMTKEMFGKGTKIHTTCSFEEFGAPLLTFTDTMKRDEDGDLWYAACKEVVLWKNGVNVWDLYVEDGEIKYHLLAAVKFDLEKNVKHELFVELGEESVRFVIGDKDVMVRIADLPEKVYVGITTCENINRFYDLKIEKGE